MKAFYSSIRTAFDVQVMNQFSRDNSWLKKIFSDMNSLDEIDYKRIMDGEIRIFSNTVKTTRGNFPDWHIDCISNYRFPLSLSDRIEITGDVTGDCLFPCELSRLQFFPPLMSYINFGDSVKSIEDYIVSVTDNWVRENPFGYGIHWRIHMESALRALSLFSILPFLSPSGQQSLQHLYILCINFVGWERIRKAPKKKHNHYIIELICFLICSMILKGPGIEKTRNIALSAMLEQIDHQFGNDGISIECSISYHRLTIEALLLLDLALVSFNNSNHHIREIRVRLAELLPKAIGFISDYIKCFGKSVQFGDSCDGRIMFFGDYYNWDPLDHRYILTLSKIVGITIPESNSADWISVYYNAGYAFCSCGRIGVCACNSEPSSGVSGHNHMDKLSWVMSVEGESVFVDPGTGMYNSTLSLRNYFRATASHNTILIDGEEQAIFDQLRSFSEVKEIDCSIEVHDPGEGSFSILMKHTGYTRINDLGAIKRTIIIEPEYVHVIDSFEGSSSHEVSFGYLLHPNLKVTQTQDGHVIIHGKDFSLLLENPTGMCLSISKRWYSDSYGSMVKTNRITYSGTIEFPATIEHTHKLSMQKIRVNKDNILE
ncbi:MAG: heparinase II/III-family protein [Candidatus Aegiribacteria sp.]|nr:heparinase II/III-family protein [Candidatus Aegiribacteria sp.]